ncbi:hypothetical protein [Photobacterium damselae]|uniref:hypothetical protein n=1 Tax=Photobacterium damselae TaxID=38293 RepID=UPI0040693AD0
MNRFLLVTAGILLSSNVIAANYVLTESVNNSGLFFEMADEYVNDDVQKFSLDINEDGKYVFTPNKDDSGDNLGISNLYSLGLDTSFDKAKELCDNLKINNKEWRLLDQKDIESYSNLENNIDGNVLAFFDVTMNNSNKYWISSNEKWDNDYYMNIAALNPDELKNGKIIAGFLSLPDGVPANVVCAEK